MYEGEAVLAWEAWEKIGAGTQAVSDVPLPRDASLRHPQFAKARPLFEEILYSILPAQWRI